MKIIFNMLVGLLIATVVFLNGCGGGGGGVPAGGVPVVSNFSGVAVDGYLYQARAFLDLNGNGQYDSGEPTTTTNESGGFTLSATQDQINNHSVVVSAIAGTTIDQDAPNIPLTSSMTMIAPAGNPSVVSPLTTQVSAKMAAGLSLADAKASVQTELGLSSVDVMSNYLTSQGVNSDAHKVAASVAEILKNIESQSSVNTTLANKFSSLTITVTAQVTPNTARIKSAASVDDAKTVMSSVITQLVNIYSVGGSISGLTSSGLVLANGVDTLSPSSGANSFTFANKKASGGSYAVTVQSNPIGQICTISNGAGNVGVQSIANISVSCSNTSGALGGTITGLATSGLILKNGTDELTVASGSNTFQFGSTVAVNSTYSVTLKTQPIDYACSIVNSSGTMSVANVTSVEIACTIIPFVATRVIAFGDGFNFVDGSGAGLSTVQTGETDITIAGRIAARYGIVVKDIVSNPLAATGGFSYATANARVAAGANSVDAQITAFLSSAGGVVAKKDLIVIAVGNWDIYDAVIHNATSMDANTTALVAAIQRLTNAGAEHVVVMPPINMSRTPWATTYVTANPAVTRMMIQNLSNSATNSFNFSLLFKLNTAYTQDRKPVRFLDRTTEFNSFAGSVTAEGSAVGNYSGIGFSALGLYTPACTVVAPAAGCALSGLAGGASSIDYQTDVFADEINLTPVTNRYLADRMIAVLVLSGWAP